MRSVQDWFDEYGQSHRNPVNKAVHWICVPLIVFSIVLMLWAVPVPGFLRHAPVPLNWAVLVAAAAWLHSLALSRPLGAGYLVLLGALLLAARGLDRSGAVSPWQAGLVIFVLAWIGQFLGHKVEGKKPSFLKDLQFLLIGPLWLLGFVYRRLGIPY